MIEIGVRSEERSGDAIIAVAVFLVCAAVYLANPWHRFTGDTVPARLLPLSLLRDGDADLAEFARARDPAIDYAFVRRGSRVYSAYPIGTPVLAMPFFIGVRTEAETLWRERLSAAVLAALSALLVVLAVRRLGGGRSVAAAVGLAYGLCTATWSISSQLLWQHTGSQLCNAAALVMVLSAGRRIGWWTLAGAVVGMAIACRPTNVIVAGAFAVVAAGRSTRCALGFLAGMAPVVVAQGWYNVAVAGHLAGGYAPYGGRVWDTVVRGQWLVNLAGILISPSRGLLVYTPVVVWSLLGAVHVLRQRQSAEERACAGICAGYLLLTSVWFNWWGGYSFGPRLMADAMPFAAVLAVPVLARPMSAALRALVVLSMLWSGIVQAGGVYRDTGRWNADPPIDQTPERLWSWRYSQLASVLSGNRVPTVPPPARQDLGSSGRLDLRDPQRWRQAGYGWAPAPESWGRWMDGSEAEMYLVADTTSQHLLEVRAIAPPGLPGWPQEVSVAVNGVAVGNVRIDVPDRWVDATVHVPASALSGDVERVRFRCRHVRSRWGRFPADLRRLSAGFETVCLVPDREVHVDHRSSCRASGR